MYKYLMLFLPLLLISCANKVEVKDINKYKCGSQVVTAEILDDDTIVLTLDGKNYVLNNVIAASGAKYENVASGIVFWNKGSDNYLEIKGQGYPMCKEIVK